MSPHGAWISSPSAFLALDVTHEAMKELPSTGLQNRLSKSSSSFALLVVDVTRQAARTGGLTVPGPPSPC
ncbi:conserved hypothetical protein [Streptomyces sviceus ATCC 29083]|uniref:Uncharacterized protein n=1 Tax=Streptomyces sviceus (strain ATCC 29083 / DSM 924 / JCM 4929 / NBRC 13980 / NCIMB 11184 / NRRL 5439 / UC 5370) TaxID=463191 RepID=B5I610_STRX2|nr:conserved hypothetical protein [Streptomyces sviceus ATCC 29083]